MIIDMVNRLVDETLKEDLDMTKKNKDKFSQMDIGVVNAVKEEMMGMVNETAAGFESLDEIIEDEDMVQREMKNDEIWDKGSKHGEVESDQIPKSDFNDQRSELEKKKEELAARMMNMPTLSNKVKKENEMPEWELEDASPVIIKKKVGKYSVNISAGMLATMANDGVIFYNENTQRSRKKKKNGETTPFLMASKVKKIYEQLISGELNGMLITLNSRIIKDDEGNILNPLNFDEDSKILTGSGVLDAVDGWHRISASRLWLKKWNIKKNQKTMDSPWDYEFITAIEHKEELGGGLIFKEYGFHQLKIQASKVKFLDIYDYANMIVRRLMTSVLRDKIETDNTRTKGTNKIVTFGTLSDAIKKNYKLITEDDVELVGDYLTKFFSKLISIFPEYFGNVSKEDRDLMRIRDDLTLELLMFHGYVAISSRLYGKEDWETKLSKLRSIIQIGQWRGYILQSDCPIWDRIFKGGDEKRIVNGSSSVSFVSKTLGDYIEFGIDHAIKNIKEDDEKKLEKLNK